MDYGDDSWGIYRDYYRDPFPHSIPSTRERGFQVSWFECLTPESVAKQDRVQTGPGSSRSSKLPRDLH